MPACQAGMHQAHARTFGEDGGAHEGAGYPYLSDGSTVRCFATSGIRAAKAVSTDLDPVLGIVWIGHKNSRSTCG